MLDIELLKTFMEVYRTRHFGQAAENLFVSQSAVSTRIRQLEEILRVPVFTRDRNNIQLTRAGQKLLRHAELILNSWSQARQEIAVEGHARIPLSIGGVPSLWDVVLQRWMHRVHRRLPDAILNIEVLGSEALLRRVGSRTLDMAFMFESPQMTDMVVVELAPIRLIMVSSRPHQSAAEAIRNGYVLVDWGTSFANAHARYFPDMPSPSVRMSLGRIAHEFLCGCGGSAYLAEAMVKDDLKAGRLFRVADAPAIDRANYAVHPENGERRRVVEKALSFLSAEAAPAARPAETPEHL